jgi:hypothetical protein
LPEYPGLKFVPRAGHRQTKLLIDSLLLELSTDNRQQTHDNQEATTTITETTDSKSWQQEVTNVYSFFFYISCKVNNYNLLSSIKAKASVMN